MSTKSQPEIYDGSNYKPQRGDSDGVPYNFGYHSSAFWTAASFSSTQSGTELMSAPGSGIAIYITDFVYSSDTAGSLELFNGTTTKLAVPGDLGREDNGNVHLNTAIKLDDNVPLKLSTGMSNSSVMVAGVKY